MNSSVIVLTSPELEWDCVLGVFTSEDEVLKYLEEDELEYKDALKEYGYIAREKIING